MDPIEAERPYALSVARARLRRASLPEDHAEDLVQEVLTEMLKGTLPRDPRAYLASAVLRRCHNLLRGEIRRDAREQAKPLPPAPLDSPDAAFLKREEVEAVEKAMAGLEPKDQLLLRWVYWEGLPVTEAARLAGVSPSSLSRARERLKANLENSGKEPSPAVSSLHGRLPRS